MSLAIELRELTMNGRAEFNAILDAEAEKAMPNILAACRKVASAGENACEYSRASVCETLDVARKIAGKLRANGLSVTITETGLIIEWTV